MIRRLMSVFVALSVALILVMGWVGTANAAEPQYSQVQQPSSQSVQQGQSAQKDQYAQQGQYQQKEQTYPTQQGQGNQDSIFSYFNNLANQLSPKNGEAQEPPSPQKSSEQAS